MTIYPPSPPLLSKYLPAVVFSSTGLTTSKKSVPTGITAFSSPKWVNKSLKALIDKILSDERWDLKFIGMQIIIEGLALAAFQTTKETSNCPLLRQLVHYVIRDEARHVTFGVNYLQEFLETLSEEEIEDRAMFAYEACVVMRARIINTELPARWFGMSEEEILEMVVNDDTQDMFNNMLFSRVMPNLKKIGLLTDKVKILKTTLKKNQMKLQSHPIKIHRKAQKRQKLKLGMWMKMQ